MYPPKTVEGDEIKPGMTVWSGIFPEKPRKIVAVGEVLVWEQLKENLLDFDAMRTLDPSFLHSTQEKAREYHDSHKTGDFP